MKDILIDQEILTSKRSIEMDNAEREEQRSKIQSEFASFKEWCALNGLHPSHYKAVIQFLRMR